MYMFFIMVLIAIILLEDVGIPLIIVDRIRGNKIIIIRMYLMQERRVVSADGGQVDPATPEKSGPVGQRSVLSIWSVL